MAMSAEHKAALAAGRRESRAIKLYMDSLGSRRRGRPVTAESLAKRVKDLEKRIAAETNVLKAIDLRQARLDAGQALGVEEPWTGRLGPISSRTPRPTKRKRISYGWRRPEPGGLKAGIGRAG
jgi:hypothetical protein